MTPGSGRYPFAGGTFLDRVIALAEARLAHEIDGEGLPGPVRRALCSDPMARPPLSAFVSEHSGADG